MSFAGKNHRGSSPTQHRTAIILAGGVLLLLAIIAGAIYYSSPYFATDAAVARFANKTLSADTSDGELQAISSNLYAALDQIIPGGQGSQPESVLAQVGRAVVQEVRGQLLAEASRRLASREGIDLALYGWQSISHRRVAIQRQYLERMKGTSPSRAIRKPRKSGSGLNTVSLRYFRGFTRVPLVWAIPRQKEPGATNEIKHLVHKANSIET